MLTEYPGLQQASVDPVPYTLAHHTLAPRQVEPLQLLCLQLSFKDWGQMPLPGP